MADRWRIPVQRQRTIMALSAIVGLVMIVLGVLWVIPKHPLFGWLWTLLALMNTSIFVSNFLRLRRGGL